MSKIYIVENFVDQKSLDIIINYLNNTEVTFDPTGYSPFGVYMQDENNNDLIEVFKKST